MDATEIGKQLLAERDSFMQTVEAAIDRTMARRSELRSQLAEALLTTSDTMMSEAEFSNAIGTLETISDDLSALLGEAGYSKEITSDWLTGKSVPAAPFRLPLLKVFVTVPLDYYVHASPAQEIRNILGKNVRSTSNIPLRGELPLDQTFDHITDTLGGRIQNRIKKKGIVTLGELLAQNREEMLDKNFGHKSLHTLNEALVAHFGPSARIGTLPEAVRRKYEWMSHAREWLNYAAGRPVPTQWSSGNVKPEYKHLNYIDLRSKEREGVEVYEQVYADLELLEALKELGILTLTQLATAPTEVIDRLCYGRDQWRAQLSAMLQPVKLEFGTKVPLFLDDDVDVYSRNEG